MIHDSDFSILHCIMVEQSDPCIALAFMEVSHGYRKTESDGMDLIKRFSQTHMVIKHRKAF